MSLYAGDPVPVGTQGGPEIFGGLPAAPVTARSTWGNMLDSIGTTLGFTGEGPARRIVGLAVVLGALALGWYLYARKK